MTNTDINYLPNQTTFTDCRADVKFKNDDVYLQNVVIHKNEDVIKMDGYAKQFLNFYFNDPSKAAIQWTINADALHLQNYLSFFNRSYTSNNTATTTAKTVTATRRDTTTTTTTSTTTSMIKAVVVVPEQNVQ